MKWLDAPNAEFERFHPVLSVLSYLLKAPMVPAGTPVVNALGPQRQCIVNIFRACVGLPPDNSMLLEHKVSLLSCFLFRSNCKSAVIFSPVGAGAASAICCF